MGDVGAFPATATRPGPDSGEEWVWQQVTQPLGPGVADVFLPAIDHPLTVVVREGTFAVGFELALDLGHLTVFADAEAGIEDRKAVEIPALVFDGEDEVLVRLDPPGDGEIVVRPVVHVAEVPGAIEKHLVALHADFLAEDFQEFHMAFLALEDGIATGVERGVMKISLAVTEGDAGELRKTGEDFIDHGDDDFPRLWPVDIDPALFVADLRLILLFQEFGNDDEVGERVTGNPRRGHGGEGLFGRCRVLLDPLQIGAVGRQKVGIKFPVCNRALDKLAGNVAGASPAFQKGGIQKAGVGGAFTGVGINHVQQHQWFLREGRGDGQGEQRGTKKGWQAHGVFWMTV